MSNNDKMFLEEITDINSVDFEEEPKTEVEDIFGNLGNILKPETTGIDMLVESAEQSENRIENSQLICGNCGTNIEIGTSHAVDFENGEQGRLCNNCYYDLNNNFGCDKEEKPEIDEDFDEPYGNLNN